MRTFLMLLGLSSGLALPSWNGDAIERPYHDVAIVDFATKHWTHVCTTGTVATVSTQADGDVHIKVVDARGHFIVAEIIPLLTVPHPVPKLSVRICGIRRYDDKHGWWEIHSAEDWSNVP